MRQPLIWPVYGRQNGPKSPFSEVRRATLQTSPRLFGQFQRNCLINSWRALSTLVLSDTRRPNRAPSHRSTPWWDPKNRTGFDLSDSFSRIISVNLSLVPNHSLTNL